LWLCKAKVRTLQKTKFASPINADSTVQSSAKKYFTPPVGQIISTSPRHPASIRGAFRDRHERWVRDAVDAGGAFDESAVLRTAKSCGPDIPTLISSLRDDDLASDGDNKPGSPGRARRKPLKPLRREGRIDPVNLW
jgi:hypothetical protein